MFARPALLAPSCGALTRPRRTAGCCLAALALLVRAEATAQVLPKTQPDLGTATALPPGPTVTDWQPRGRAAIGTKIVITGPAFTPSEVVATIGGSKFVLPVRLATSTTTRIELDVPAAALGQFGTLAISHRGTQGTVLETSYVIDALRPAIENAPTITSPPFSSVSLTVRVKEFTGATLNNDQVSVGGTCGFVKSSTVRLGTRTREPDLRISVVLAGWFERSGSCALQLGITPIAANGSSLPVVQLSLPLSIPVPTRYTFESTGQLTAKLAPALLRAGLGSVCEGTTSTGATGVTTLGGDLQILIRGGALDVSCAFRTAQITLGGGVRLVEMRWVSNKVGDRCAKAGSVTSTLPSLSFQLTRGSVLVNPDANQPARDFFVFGDGALVVDGVTIMTVQQPTSVLLPMIVDLRCAPMTLPLQTGTGTSPPTTSPQSFGVILERIILEGPAGLTLNELLRGG
jgi:hypothetical protein